MINFRVLNISDVEQFKCIRLEALERFPESFGSDYEYEKKLPIKDFERRLIQSQDRLVVGAFNGEQLIATCSYFREQGKNVCHKGHIVGVYCTPTYQKTGITTRLLSFLIEYLKKLEGLSVLQLTVNSRNEHAIRLYEKLGFTTFGIDERALFDGKEYRSEHLMQKFL